MDWRHDFIDGNTRASCSICGRSRRFPDEMAYCPDRLFRCLDACMEKSAFETDQEIAAARQRAEAPDTSIGLKPPWDP